MPKRTGVAEVNSRKTHCPRGHLLSADNLRPEPGRKCRICKNARNKAWRLGMKLAKGRLAFEAVA